MDFVGIDLAWGQTAGTGLCLIRDAKAVISTRVRRNDEIVAWIRQHAGQHMIAAIDAPLVVPNLTGRRRCESLLSACFQSAQAGAHSANRSLAAFVEGIRAARLASELDLDINPVLSPGQPTRRGLEVYPHPALVALCSLETTLKYKAKRGRSVESRHAAFRRLFSCLEAFAASEPAVDVTASPRWLRLRETATTSPAHATLDRCEDEIDAYVCAYIGLYYWTHGLERCRIVGSLAEGYIVTPVTETQGKCLDLESAKPLPTPRPGQSVT